MARQFSSHRLRERRQAAGLQREELALLVHRTAGAVYALERGHSLPSVGVLAALADALQCPVDDLFDDIPEPATVAA